MVRELEEARADHALGGLTGRVADDEDLRIAHGMVLSRLVGPQKHDERARSPTQRVVTHAPADGNEEARRLDLRASPRVVERLTPLEDSTRRVSARRHAATRLAVHATAVLGRHLRAQALAALAVTRTGVARDHEEHRRLLSLS
jgi:hypothetical protein